MLGATTGSDAQLGYRGVVRPVVSTPYTGWHTGRVTSEQLLQRISIDPGVCHGQPCVKGTRVLVTVVLDALAAGLSAAEIVRHYPSITEEDVRAAAAYGAWLAKQEIHALFCGS
jgi:uncharacterized protein (DUF433 family)